MDNEWQEILKKLNAACAEGTVDLNDSDSVDKFLSQEICEELPPNYNGAIDDEMLAPYEEQEELKLKIRREKQKGKYTTFHKMLLTGKLKTSNPFVMDILCNLTIKNDKEKIKNCKECLTAEICPKRSEINRREKNGFHGKIKQVFEYRTKILDTYNEIHSEGVTYESAKSDTLKKLQISGRTFDKYYKTRDKDPLTILKILIPQP